MVNVSARSAALRVGPGQRARRSFSPITESAHLLTEERELWRFDCGKPAPDNWLARRAQPNQSPGTNRTWVITTTDEPRVVAFYASATASVLRSTAPKPWTRNQPAELLALLLGRVAVDVRHTGRGLAAALLNHFMGKALEVSQAVGVRVVLVHAKDDDAVAFYSRYHLAADGS